MLHALPVRVHVVVRRVGVQGALVARDFLYEPAVNEAVLRVEKGATEETNHRARSDSGAAEPASRYRRVPPGPRTDTSPVVRDGGACSWSVVTGWVPMPES